MIFEPGGFVGAHRLVDLARPEHVDASRGEISPQVVPDVALVLDQRIGAGDDRGELFSRSHAVGRAAIDILLLLAHQPGDPDHEEFVEVGARDRQEAHAFEQRVRGVTRFLKHAAVEREPAQLSVEIALAMLAAFERIVRRGQASKVRWASTSTARSTATKFRSSRAISQSIKSGRASRWRRRNWRSSKDRINASSGAPICATGLAASRERKSGNATRHSGGALSATNNCGRWSACAAFQAWNNSLSGRRSASSMKLPPLRLANTRASTLRPDLRGPTSNAVITGQVAQRSSRWKACAVDGVTRNSLSPGPGGHASGRPSWLIRRSSRPRGESAAYCRCARPRSRAIAATCAALRDRRYRSRASLTPRRSPCSSWSRCPPQACRVPPLRSTIPTPRSACRTGSSATPYSVRACR